MEIFLDSSFKCSSLKCHDYMYRDAAAYNSCFMMESIVIVVYIETTAKCIKLTLGSHFWNRSAIKTHLLLLLFIHV